MKLNLHLIENNRLIAIANETLSPQQVNHIAEVVNRWNSGEINELVFPLETEIIDMRTPQKEAIESVLRELISEYDKQAIESLIAGAV